MILITVGLMCLVEFKKEQLDKNRKLIELKNSLKNVFYSVLKQKTSLINICLKEARICSAGFITKSPCMVTAYSKIISGANARN